MATNLFVVLLAAAQVHAPEALPANVEKARANAEVVQAAREFRRTVYQNFRGNRAEFDRRWNAGEELWRHWTALKQPAAYREEVRTWFVEAGRSAGPLAVGELPPLPQLPEPTLTTTLEQSPAEDDPAPPIPPEVIAPPLPILPPDPDFDAAEPTGDSGSGVFSDKIHSLFDLSESLFQGTNPAGQ